MVESQDSAKMYYLLEFIFDIEKIEKYVKNDWSKIYDPDYIENEIIYKMQEKIPLLADLLSDLSEKATGGKSNIVKNLE